MKVKVIFIKDYNYYLNRTTYKKGDITDAVIKHGGYLVDNIYFGVNDEVISLADWREQQINDILNES